MGAQEDADELSDAKNEEIATSNQQQHKEKSLEAQETKLSSDRNTAKFSRTQESFGEQEASLANLDATEATCDVSPAEQLVETQTIAETIEILAEVIGHAINTFDQDPVNKIRQHKWIGLDKTTFFRWSCSACTLE